MPWGPTPRARRGNLNANATTFTVSINGGSQALYYATGNVVANATYSGTSAAMPVAGFTAGSFDWIANFSYNVPPATGTVATLTDSASLAAFTGAGSYNFSVAGFAGTYDVSANVADFGGAVNASDSVSVVYAFLDAEAAPVPEPASLLLVAAGLGIAGLARRRRG